MVKREAGRHNGKRRVRVWQRQDISLLPGDIRQPFLIGKHAGVL